MSSITKDEKPVSCFLNQLKEMLRWLLTVAINFWDHLVSMKHKSLFKIRQTGDGWVPYSQEPRGIDVESSWVTFSVISKMYLRLVCLSDFFRTLAEAILQILVGTNFWTIDSFERILIRYVILKDRP